MCHFSLLGIGRLVFTRQNDERIDDHGFVSTSVCGDGGQVVLLHREDERAHQAAGVDQPESVSVARLHAEFTQGHAVGCVCSWVLEFITLNYDWLMLGSHLAIKVK